MLSSANRGGGEQDVHFQSIHASYPCARGTQSWSAISALTETLVQGALWQRKGWKEMDKMRAQLEDLRELRDLVRSLGRGGGWGPLRRAPVQYLDMKGRPGLLRTILEQQETRGLTRSDDISRLLPSEVIMSRAFVRTRHLLFQASIFDESQLAPHPRL